MDHQNLLPADLGTVEDEIFKSRRDKDLYFKKKNKERRRAAKRSRSVSLTNTTLFSYLLAPPLPVMFVCCYHTLFVFV